MSVENPFRNPTVEPGEIAPTYKSLTYTKDAYFIDFQYNGEENIKCTPNEISPIFDNQLFTLAINVGTIPPPDGDTEAKRRDKINKLLISEAKIRIDRLLTNHEKGTDIIVSWYRSDLSAPITHGDKISSCTIKFEDARPRPTSPPEQK